MLAFFFFFFFTPTFLPYQRQPISTINPQPDRCPETALDLIQPDGCLDQGELPETTQEAISAGRKGTLRDGNHYTSDELDLGIFEHRPIVSPNCAEGE